MRRLQWKKIVPFILLILLISAGVTAQAAEEPTVIKVGYTLNSGTIESPMLIGEEGYGYEYLNKIFKYMEGNYELEFVYCESSEIHEMLDSGEIDIFGPMVQTPYNEDDYLFTEESFGDGFVFLSALSDHAEDYGGYDHINGVTIAVQENDPSERILLEYIEENQLDVEIVYFTESDFEWVLEEYGYDLCLCTSLHSFSNLSPVVNLGVKEIYYVATTENAELIDQMNIAMEEVHETEYMYQEKLYLEYYNYSILSDSYITDEEFTLLQEQGTYYIGIEDIQGAIGYKDENGEFQGIAVDVMKMIAEITGIQYEFVEVTEDTTEEELQALNFSFLSYDNIGETYTESTPFCEISYMLIERRMDEDENIENIGLLSHYGFSESENDGYILEREGIVYDNLEDMMTAYNKGEIDSMIMTSVNMNLFRENFVDENYLSTTLDMSLNLCLIFHGEHSDDLVELFNKVIEQLDENEINSLVINHSIATSDAATIQEIIQRNPYGFAGVILVLAVVIICIILVAADRRKKTLSKLLNYDKLTGLYSGHKFEEEVKKALTGDLFKQYSIITIDIDHFKYINDVFGYEVGNKVIQIVAGCIKKIAPEALVIARNSSDVFLVLIKHDNGKPHKMSFDKVDRDKLFDELIPYIGDTYKLSFSMGIYDIVDRRLDINFMVDCANIARLEGKGVANTTVHQFDHNMDEKRQVSTNVIANMVQGIKGHEFVVYYQPKINLTTQEVVGAEALVRWYKDDSVIPPNHFIPLFEKNGFIEKLDFYVLEEVCIFINKYPNTPRISVNLSGVTVTKTEVVTEILNIVDTYKVPHEKLEFEITETAVIDKFKAVVATLETLRNSGFLISMDDFGVGISSLSRLKSMPIDILKIDREFIWDSIGNERGVEILKSIINMANGLKLETIAEGVETKVQEEMLLRLGCEIGQGYLYSPPQAEEKFLGWIQH